MNTTPPSKPIDPIETNVEVLPLDASKGDWAFTEGGPKCRPRLNVRPSDDWSHLLQQTLRDLHKEMRGLERHPLHDLFSMPPDDGQVSHLHVLIDVGSVARLQYPVRHLDDAYNPDWAERVHSAVYRLVERTNLLAADQNRRTAERESTLRARREVEAIRFEELKRHMQGK